MVALKQERLVAKSASRDRLPRWIELLKLTRHFKKLLFGKSVDTMERAEYGELLIQYLADDLTARFGRGYGVVNLS